MNENKLKDTKFKNFENMKNEPEEVMGARIMKINAATEPAIHSYEFSSLKKNGTGTYAAVKEKFGPLAATDPDRTAKAQKDSRFSLNPLLRESLSVEQEERRVIDEKVRSQIEEIRDEVREQSHKEGYSAGLKKGFEESSRQMQLLAGDTIRKFENLLSEFENAKRDIFLANERFLIELVFRIARKIILKEISVDRDYVLRLAKELVNQVSGREKIVLRISPEDMQMIDDLKNGLSKNFPEIQNLTIEASSQIPIGGVRVETDWNSIDSDVESQLERLHQALTHGGGDPTA